MSEIYWAPKQVERRLYRSNGSHKSTLNHIPALCQAQPIIKFGEPLKQIYTREQLIQLLDEQMELSVSLDYPLCLAVAEFRLNSEITEELGSLILFSVARLINLILRPTDIVIRYGNKMVAFILHESNEQGGRCAVTRLTERLSQGVTVEEKKIQLIPSFGISANLVGETKPADRLLVNAENALWALRGW